MGQGIFTPGYILRMVLTGFLAGFIALLYRKLLEIAETLLLLVIGRAETSGFLTVLWFTFLILLARRVARIVDWDSSLSGGGMAHFLGVYRKNWKSTWKRNIPGNLAGGMLTLLCGVSIGSESPAIQLGASVADGIADNLPPVKRVDRKDFLAAGAGIGFAAGFSAPLAGLCFLFRLTREKRRPLRFWTSAVFALGIAHAMALIFYGRKPFFILTADHLKNPFSPRLLAAAILLGILTGGMALLFRASLLGVDTVSSLLRRKWKISRFAIFLPVFLLAGVISFLLPEAAGSGCYLFIFPRMDFPLGFLVLLLGVKLLFTAVSPGCGLPGGMLFPVLAMGALCGKLFAGTAAITGTAFSLPESTVLMLAGMAAFFCAVTAMPLTASVLLAEMTWRPDCLPALLFAAFSSFLVLRLSRQGSIYTELFSRLEKERKGAMPDAAPPVAIDKGAFKQME